VSNSNSDIKFPPQKRFKRHSLAAIAEIDRLGVNPLEMLIEVYRLSIEAYKRERGLSDKGDAGPAFLSTAQAAANNLASYRYPKLSAIGVKDLSEGESDRPPMTTREAMKIIASDPFALNPGSTEEVIDQMASGTQTPHLVKGESNE